MKTSERNTLVTFLERTVSRDTTGQVLEEWNVFKTTFAKIEFSQADDQGHDRAVIQNRVTITCHPVFGLNTGHRALINNVKYDINNIRHLSRSLHEISANQIVD